MLLLRVLLLRVLLLLLLRLLLRLLLLRLRVLLLLWAFRVCEYIARVGPRPRLIQHADLMPLRNGLDGVAA